MGVLVMKIDFITAVRGRDNARIQKCMNSIKGDFVGKKIVVDYGSKTQLRLRVLS